MFYIIITQDTLAASGIKFAGLKYFFTGCENNELIRGQKEK